MAERTVFEIHLGDEPEYWLGEIRRLIDAEVVKAAERLYGELRPRTVLPPDRAAIAPRDRRSRGQ